MKQCALYFAFLFGALGCQTASEPASGESESADVTGTTQGLREAPEGLWNLWYTAPASEWTEALPIGNGRLGGMVFGGAPEDRIQLNDDTLWDGYARDRNNSKALEALPEVRRLLFAEKSSEASALAEKTLLGIPERIKSYQTLGDLRINFGHKAPITNYRRHLNLEDGVVEVRYDCEGVTFTRTYFASAIDDVLVVRLTSSKPGALAFNATLDRSQDAVCRELDDNSIALFGRILRPDEATGENRGMSFRAELRAKHDGTSQAISGQLRVSGATSATLYLASGTDYRGVNPQTACVSALNTVRRKAFEKVLDTHRTDMRQWFNRCTLDLGGHERAAISTGERLEAARRKDFTDPHLAALYFQFGRYLLYSSSRPGTMPANLQGLWNEHMDAPWNADYHTNINLQMNYWPAEVTGLSECHLPLFDLMESLVPHGEETARTMYGADGWVVHHLTDVWGFTAPADGVWGVWPMGAAWLAQHPWEHYQFTLDQKFLRERGYPLMKGAAQFLLDFLVEDEQGRLVTNPSHSPENSFILPNGEKAMFTYGATMDLMMIHELFTNCIAASEILDIDADFRKELASALQRLAPLQISSTTGRLQEWIKDYEEAEPGHRHMSHLYGFHPGDQITLEGTPELAVAIRKSLDYRLANGGGHTGWSRAWMINFFARFREGNTAREHLRMLFAKSTLPNLLDSHPPFQIDGNFGATAGIAEMLLQSHAGAIHLLPALPDAWSEGKVKGLHARGGVTVDMAWSEGRLSEVSLIAPVGRPVTLRSAVPLSLRDADSIKTSRTRVGEDHLLTFTPSKSARLALRAEA